MLVAVSSQYCSRFVSVRNVCILNHLEWFDQQLFSRVNGV
jgi:hypothetical protein